MPSRRISASSRCVRAEGRPPRGGAGRGGAIGGGTEKAGLAPLELPAIYAGWKWVELELERETVVGSADWCGRAVRTGVSWFWE